MLRINRSLHLAVVTTTIATLATVPVSVATASSRPHPLFHAVTCPGDTFPPEVHVECGYVVVPENRAHPNGRTIHLHAALVPATAAPKAPDPIVFLDGGPSFGAINSFALDAYFAEGTFTGNRDIVLVDTRGTGTSRPLLNCPEIDAAEVDSFYAPPTVHAQAPQVYGSAVKACHDRLVKRGIDLSAYNSAEGAADLDALRRALGVAKWNLLAVSADGIAGLTYLRLYLHGIRSAIIDSGQSTQMLLGPDYDRGQAEELAAIFTGCEANAACNARYPHIRQLFAAMVTRLNRHPVTITFPDFEPHPVSLEFDGAALFFDTINSIFPGDLDVPSAIPDLLETLWRQTHGELADTYREFFGTGPVENSHASDFFAVGKTLSYACHDSVNFITRGDLHKAAHDLPAFAQRYLSPNYDLGDGFTIPVSPAGCRIWDVGRAAAAQHKPVRSDIPTLVLSGEYDIGVPPYIVRQVARRLGNAHYYEVPNSAHLQLAVYNPGSVCARAIAAQFLARPSRTPDSSCLADIAPADFTPPGALQTTARVAAAASATTRPFRASGSARLRGGV